MSLTCHLLSFTFLFLYLNVTCNFLCIFNSIFHLPDTLLNSILFFLTILIGWFSSRDMSRIEPDCKNYKRFVNNKCDRSCKKSLNKARIRTAQGLRLKNAQIKKHDESNIYDQTYKHSQTYRWRRH